MAIVLTKPKKQYEYIPLEERGADKPAKFKFRILSKKELALLGDGILKMDSATNSLSLSNASYILNAVKLALEDVENITDGKKTVELTKDLNGEVSYDFLDMLPDDLIQELGSVIISVSKDPSNAELYLGELKEEK